MLEAPNKVKCWTILNRVAKISQFSNAICIKHEPFHLYFREISKQVKNSRERDIKHTKSMQTKYIKNHLLRKKWIFINNKDEELYLPDAVVSQSHNMVIIDCSWGKLHWEFGLQLLWFQCIPVTNRNYQLKKSEFLGTFQNSNPPVALSLLFPLATILLINAMCLSEG